MDAARRSADDWNALCSHRSALERIARQRVPSPSDVDDVVQEAILRAAENEHVRVHEAGAWMTRVVVNLCHDLHRRPAVVDLTDVEVPSPRDSLEDHAVVRDELRRVSHRFARLPHRQRTAVTLRCQGQGVDEVAAALGTSYKTAESLLSRARTTLRGPLVLLGLLWAGAKKAVPSGAAVTLTGLAVTVALPSVEAVPPQDPVPTATVELQTRPAVVTRPVAAPVRVPRPRAAARVARSTAVLPTRGRAAQPVVTPRVPTIQVPIALQQAGPLSQVPTPRR